MTEKYRAWWERRELADAPLIKQVALHVFMFVFHTEELEDDFALAVGTEGSHNVFMAAAVQPDRRGFAGGPDKSYDRQRRVAFFAGQVGGMQPLRFGEQRTDAFRIRLEAFRERIPVAHLGNEHLHTHAFSSFPFSYLGGCSPLPLCIRDCPMNAEPPRNRNSIFLR